MRTFARYTTFKEGELEATLQGLDPQGQYRHLTAAATQPATHRATEPGRSKSGLITSHSLTVTYPDATTGTCRYLRGGPQWHIFRFEHTSSRSGKTASLPVQNQTQRLANTLAVIEEQAQTLAARAFTEAIEREQRDHFRRALPPPLYKIAQGERPAEHREERPQMKAKEAKQVAGRYALCIRVGRSLLPTGDSWDKMAEAVKAWKSGNDVSRVIGCCCRWKRRWEEPSYNPLHGDSAYPHPPLPFSCSDHQSAQNGARRAVEPVAEPMAKIEIPPLPEEDIPPPGDADIPPEEDDNSSDPLYPLYPLWEGDDEE